MTMHMPKDCGRLLAVGGLLTALGAAPFTLHAADGDDPLVTAARQLLDGIEVRGTWRNPLMPAGTGQETGSPGDAGRSATLELAALAAPAPTAEQVLTFSLVTRAMDVKTEKVAAIDGQVISAGRYGGTAVFADGRIANKEFTFSFDFRKGAGPFYGYSTYTFVDGSSLVMRFEGMLVPGQPMVGHYTVLSGSGIYAGATGSGRFEKVDDPWENANLYKGSLRITTR